MPIKLLSAWLCLLSFSVHSQDFIKNGFDMNNVIISGCVIGVNDKYGDGNIGYMYLLVFDLEKGFAHIIFSDGTGMYPPQASIDFKRQISEEIYYEANGGIENRERFWDVFTYLKTLDLKYYETYKTALADVKNNITECNIPYHRLDEYMKTYGNPKTKNQK